MNLLQALSATAILALTALLGTPLQCALSNDVYVTAPTDEIIASDWNEAKENPRTAVYYHEADHFIVRYEPADVPAHFNDNEQRSCLEVKLELGL